MKLELDFEKRATDIADRMRLEIAADVRAQFQAALADEIAATVESLQNKDAEIAGAVGDDTFNLGVVLKLKTERLEMASYLKGLQFCAEKAAKP